MSRYISAEDSKPSPILNPDGSLEQFMLRIAGQRYRCACMCNVFHKPDQSNPDRYECNACGQQFEAHD